LRQNASLRRELSERAACWARANLDPQRTVAATLEIYRRVLSG